MNLFRKKHLELLLPAKGELIELEGVPDEAFAQKMLGEGYAVNPTEGIIVAPVSGTISHIFPTGHAFGIDSDEAEILVHIGIDTVELKGEGFKALKKEGDSVKAGEAVIEVDLERIKEAGKSPITPVIVTPKDEKKKLKLDLNKQQVTLG